MTGRIVKGIAGFYYIDVPGEGIIECHAKGTLRRDRYKRPLVGDVVDLEYVDREAMTGSMTAIHDRKSELIRPEIANVDQVLIVMAYEKPAPNLQLLDRFLICLEKQNADCIICFNKSDKADDEKIDRIASDYRDCGFPVLSISAKADDDMEALKKLLEGKMTALAGPSGVGKSTIINRLCEKYIMETGGVSEKTARGKHTTRHSEIFRLRDFKDTYIADTPGFTALELMEDIDSASIKAYYREFFPYEGMCRFDPCSHTHEPGCAVKQALADGYIGRLRYDNYHALYTEQRDKEKNKY
ncbi:MAG: ribosome small subunit-dependent GTPase A [Lachnospiraceae bacterium]|nr:ribosome small subunit-dependent GTPase A [Lachnospiraceae bacterium]